MNKKTNQIREDFLNFFKKKGHVIVPSSSLVPSNDSTLLFTNAGMNQFKDIFLGQKKPYYPRIATVQRCLRTGGKHNDLENVGYTSKHHTFFEMLGNFSFNDYFKKEAIEYAWELLTSKEWFGIPKKKLWVSVYEDDNETYEIWNNIIKIPSERIIRIGDKDNCKYNSENFWQMGDTGPCGPCTEIFYNYGKEEIDNPVDLLNNRNYFFIEIWNIVFIEFNRISKTKIISLPNKSIDTGMGLERISSILQNVYSNYEIDVFKKLIKTIFSFSNIKDIKHVSLKVIADHIRACSYIIADGILPSNEQRGYVLRRIIRRALRHGRKIGIKEYFFYKLVSSVIQIMGEHDDILKQKKEKIEEILKVEEIQFSRTLDKGLKILHFEIQKTKNNVLSGKTAFYLYDTLGFPIDLTADVCREKNIKIDYNSYKIAKNKQKVKSNSTNKFHQNYNNNIIINDTCIFEGYKKYQTKSLVKHIFIKNKSVLNISEKETGIIFLDTTSFYGESGGQVGDIGHLYHQNGYFIVEKTKKYGNTIGHIGKLVSGKITVNDFVFAKINKIHRNSIQLNHSSTHLLHAALRKILGENVLQKGSLVTSTYLRFDFSYSYPITLYQIQKIENIVNIQIRNNIIIKNKELSLEEAKQKNATALFENRYDSIVRVIFISDFSIELCGGTHTKRTGDIGLFKIISQYNIASGIKRIEAITGKAALDYLHQKDNDIQDMSLILNCKDLEIKEKLKKLIIKVQNLENKITFFQEKENLYYVKKLLKNVDDIQGTKLLIHTFYEHEHKLLKTIADKLKKDLKNAIIILINILNHRFTIIVSVTNNLIHSITATEIVKIITKKTNGKGGGKQERAEGGGIDTKKLPKILNYIQLWITKHLKNKKKQ